MKAAAAASTPIPARTEMTLWPKPVKKLTHKCRESRDLSAGTSRMAANEAMSNRPGKSSVRSTFSVLGPGSRRQALITATA
jgi:hypothetical protein